MLTKSWSHSGFIEWSSTGSGAHQEGVFSKTGKLLSVESLCGGDGTGWSEWRSAKGCSRCSRCSSGGGGSSGSCGVRPVSRPRRTGGCRPGTVHDGRNGEVSHFQALWLTSGRSGWERPRRARGRCVRRGWVLPESRQSREVWRYHS